MESARHFFIQTCLQQYRRCPCNHSAHCSFCSPMCFWSVCRWRTMICTRLAQIPRNCQCKWLLVSSSAPGTSLGSSGSPGMFSLYMVRIVTTALPNLVPPRHIDDCYAIPPPSLRILWSAVIKSPKFSALGTIAPARLLQEDLVIFVFQEISQFGSFGKCV